MRVGRTYQEIRGFTKLPKNVPTNEIAKVARVEVDKGNPYGQGSYEDLRKLALRVEEVLRSDRCLHDHATQQAS